MPIVKKLLKLGVCRAVILPKEWLDWIKREHGSEVVEVLIEVDNELRIQPVLPKKEGAC